jgi:uncharacterized protein
MTTLDKVLARTNYIVLFMTNKCNLACKYCFNELEQHEPRKDLPEEMIPQLIKFINSCQSKDFQILFYGGEPLVAWDCCKRLQDTLTANCDKNFYFKLQTNGTLINESVINDLKERDISVFLSVDGNKERHDSNRIYHDGRPTWDVVVNKMELLNKLNMPFSIYSVTDTTDDLAKDTIDLFEKGAFRIRTMIPSRCDQLTPFVFDNDKLQIEFLQILEYLKTHKDKYYMNFGNFKYEDIQSVERMRQFIQHNIPTRYCQTFNGRIYIQSNGDMLSCSAQLESKYAWGNIFEPNFGINSKYNIFDRVITPQCNSCDSRIGCRRCPYRQWQETGSYSACTESTYQFANVMTKVLETGGFQNG